MNSQSASFEKADQSKAEAIFELMSACSADMVRQGFNHWAEYYSTIEAIEKRSKHYDTYVMYSPEGKATATVSLSTTPPPYYRMNNEKVNYCNAFTQVEKSKAIYVSGLGVHPDLQGSGLGKKLMAFVEEKARELGMESIRFDTRGEFTRVVEFYKKLGYTKLPQVMITEDSGENYFLFEKILKEI